MMNVTQMANRMPPTIVPKTSRFSQPMSRTNEIVSMLTAGVSVPRLLFPLISVGVLTACLSGVLNY
jgi:hypothetical protein